MADLTDPNERERLAHESEPEYMRRREFLQRTALTAGLTTAAALSLPSNTLLAEAAKRQRRPLPAPKNLPVDTFVVLMMENRSFDHYLGFLPGADGRQAGLTYIDKEGKPHQTRRLAPDWQGCGHPDPDHGWKGGRTQLNGGKCDGFLKSGENDEFAISYYQDGDLGFIQHAAKAFTTFDHFHCSLMGPTLPNREYMWAGESYGHMDNYLPVNEMGFPDNTIMAALDGIGVSNRYFSIDLPVSALWGVNGLKRTGEVPEFYARAATGTLPNVCFVDPAFAASVGEGPGLSADEHPHGDVRAGQAFMADVIHACLQSPQWERMAIFITYDEWGGFFDHVAPPRVPDQRNDPDINKDFGLQGFRVPTLGISPYVRRGHVAHSNYSFESILKFICYRFGLQPLNKRVAYARNIARSFDWESKPRLELPDLPDPPTVVSMPCPGNPDGDAARPKDHDFMTMVTSGYLERLGYDYKPATPERTFREPSKLKQAFAASTPGFKG